MSRLDEIATRAEAATQRIIDTNDPFKYRRAAGEVERYARVAARTDIPDLVGLVRTLGEALGWYAEPSNHGIIHHEDGTIEDPAFDDNYGDRSRAALALYDEWTTG